jgi:hypothetical protein
MEQIFELTQLSREGTEPSQHQKKAPLWIQDKENKTALAA